MKYEFEKFEHYRTEYGKLIPAYEEGRIEMMGNAISSIQQDLDIFITEEDKKKPEHMRMTRQNVYDMVCNLTYNYDDGNPEKSLDRIFALRAILNKHCSKIIKVDQLKEPEEIIR